MRKSFDGLSALIKDAFPAELASGALFVFLNRPKTSMKVLYWDGDGSAIWYKRLEKGCFSKKTPSGLMSRREFFMLLEGIIPKRLSLRYQLKKSNFLLCHRGE